jgi:hypothetical protein
MTSTILDPKVAERDAKFNQWLQNKSLRDKAIELLFKLSTDRSKKEDKLREVAIAIAAADRILASTQANLNLTSSKGENEESLSLTIK